MKKLKLIIVLVVLAIMLAACGSQPDPNLGVASTTGPALGNQVVVYSNSISGSSGQADWFNSLIGQVYKGRRIIKIDSIATAGEYGTYLYALVELGD